MCVILASALLCDAEKPLATQSSLLNGEKAVIGANATIVTSAVGHGCVLACMTCMRSCIFSYKRRIGS